MSCASRRGYEQVKNPGYYPNDRKEYRIVHIPKKGVPIERREYLSFEIVLSFFSIKPLDRISKHGSWHFCAIGIEKFTELFFIHSFSDFSEHPATGFMDEIMGVCEESGYNIESEFFISLLDLIKARKDNDTIRPEMFARNTRFDKGNSLCMGEAGFDIRPNDMFRRSIDEIPVIDVFTVIHIKISKSRNGLYVSFCPLDEYQDSSEAFFVIFASEKYFDGFESRLRNI